VKKISTGKLYGNFSHGNHYYDFFEDKELIIKQNVVKDDLSKAGININKIKNFTCMNVGTGRESLALSQLGAKEVFHYDISKEHVDRFKKLLSKKFKKLKIVSKNADLCKYKLPKNKFDFVYLNGIVHHFANVQDGLLNCSNSVKDGGFIWVYFYRSGTFKWFVCQMIRELIDVYSYNEFFLNLSNIYGDGDTSNLLVSRIMDDFYAPYIHLYNLNNYKNFMESIGFKAYKYVNSKSNKNVDHKNLHHSAIIVFKKIKNMQKINKLYNLKPETSINQLDKKLYKSRKIHKIIDLFNKIKRKKNKKICYNIFSCIIGMHKLSAYQYYGGEELPPRYDELYTILKNTYKNLD